MFRWTSSKLLLSDIRTIQVQHARCVELCNYADWINSQRCALKDHSWTTERIIVEINVFRFVKGDRYTRNNVLNFLFAIWLANCISQMLYRFLSRSSSKKWNGSQNCIVFCNANEWNLGHYGTDFYDCCAEIAFEILLGIVT